MKYRNQLLKILNIIFEFVAYLCTHIETHHQPGQSLLFFMETDKFGQITNYITLFLTYPFRNFILTIVGV